MNLRLMKTLFVITCFPFLIISLPGFSQEKTFGKTKFSFTKATYSIYLSELEALEGSFQANKLIQFAASLPILEPILANADIPDDFKFLSIYSKYQTNLASKTNLESGIFWNLHEGYKNLNHNQQVDLRKHLVISTHTAASELQKKQHLYNNWAVTLFSHLADAQIINSLGVSKKWKGDFIVLDSPQYSAVIEFLAFKTFVENSYVRVSNLEHQMAYQYLFGNGKTLGEIAERLKLNIHDVISANQWLVSGLVPNNKYPVILYIPVSRYYEIKKLDESQGNLAEANSGFPILSLVKDYHKGKGGTFYIINGVLGIQAQMGDQFINLAYKGDVSHKKFLEYNDMKPMDHLSVGQVYYLKDKKDKADIPYHVTLPEETLWDISQTYGVKLAKLIDYNRLERVTKLVPGQLIWMRDKRPKNEAIQYMPVKEQVSPGVQQTPTYNYTANTNNTFQKNEEEVTYVKPVEKVVSNTKVASTETIIEIKKEYPTLEEPPVKKKFLVHDVKNGETLFALSQKYNVSIKQLYDLNNLINSEIEVGDKLIIKKN